MRQGQKHSKNLKLFLWFYATNLFIYKEYVRIYEFAHLKNDFKDL